MKPGKPRTKSVHATAVQEPLLADVDESDIGPEDYDALGEFNTQDDAAGKQTVRISDEPMFASLLRRAVEKLWPGDPVLRDFCDFVAAPLSAKLGHVAAKGGDFVLEREKEGKQVEDRYRYDQSFRAHLINGLLPVLRIARRLKEWGAPQMRRLNERSERLFVAGYVLHDWLKLPDTDAMLRGAGLSHDKVNANVHRALVEDVFRSACRDFGLDQFLQSVGGAEMVLHDLIFIACNTQVKWGTMRNVSALPHLTLDGPTLSLCEQLSRLADLIVYIGRNPRATVMDKTIDRELNTLSDGKASLVCHHLSDVRGVLTNLIHNAATDAMRCPHREPILYAPSGVVYLQRNDAPEFPNIETVVTSTIDWITHSCRLKLAETGSGLIRGPIGIKVPGFYAKFFTAASFVMMTADMMFRHVIIDTKESKAAERYHKIDDITLTADLPVDIQVDQLAEWCYLCELKLREANIDIDAAHILLDSMQIGDLREAFDRVPRDNHTTGGLGLHWYFAAGQYRKRHAGLNPAEWRDRVGEFAHRLAQAVGNAPLAPDTWDDLRDYIRSTISFLPKQGADMRTRASFGTELSNYTNAKRRGRGSVLVSSMSSTPYQTQEQREAESLFAPQVYSNKIPLHGTKAIRGIDPISQIETMLRQVFMNHSKVIGGKFEGQKMRYLYFYPMYYFSPETLDVFKDMHDRLGNLSLTEIRKQLVDDKITPPALRLDAETLQRLDQLLLDAAPPDPGKDHMARMRFPKDTPITFYFIGIKSGREPTDAEAWVAPALLALLMPLCMDVKVVASESSLPLLSDSDGMAETVMLDGAHAFVRYLTGAERINIDAVYPILRRLLVSYFIHLDANSGTGKGGFDYAWSRIALLARNVSESPAFACHYLFKWERKDKNHKVTAGKARLYQCYAAELEKLNQGGNQMTLARELTARYRAFYRAKKYNSNSILRPVAIASRSVLNADRFAFGDADSLIEITRGELSAFMERVSKGTADGYPARGVSPAERETAIQAFAEYFVSDVFFGAFRGDRAALRGKQLNLLKSACEVIYRDAQARDKAERDTTEDETTNESETE